MKKEIVAREFKDGVEITTIHNSAFRCVSCRYYDVDCHLCHRYPHFETRKSLDWCGEWKSVEANTNE